MINITKREGSSTFDVYHENGAKVGEMYVESDGYYVWDGLGKRGYLPAHILRTLADLLDKLNAAWDATIQSDASISLNVKPTL